MCSLINCASKIIDPVRLWTINALFILNLNFVWRTLSHKLHNFPALASHLSRARTFLMVELPPVPPVCLCSPMDVKGPPQLVWLRMEWLAAAWSIDPFGKEQKHKDCSWGNDAVSVSTHRGEADMLLSRLTPNYYSLDMNTAALSPPKSAHVPPKHDGNTGDVFQSSYGRISLTLSLTWMADLGLQPATEQWSVEVKLSSDLTFNLKLWQEADQHLFLSLFITAEVHGIG